MLLICYWRKLIYTFIWLLPLINYYPYSVLEPFARGHSPVWISVECFPRIPILSRTTLKLFCFFNWAHASKTCIQNLGLFLCCCFPCTFEILEKAAHTHPLLWEYNFYDFFIFLQFRSSIVPSISFYILFSVFCIFLPISHYLYLHFPGYYPYSLSCFIFISSSSITFRIFPYKDMPIFCDVLPTTRQYLDCFS